jgi:mannose-6-phosphate isomerase
VSSTFDRFSFGWFRTRIGSASRFAAKAGFRVRNTQMYPIKLRPQSIEKVWGGHELARVLHRKIPGRAAIGEIWVAWDGLWIKNGRWRGQLLRDLVARQRDAVLGPGIDPTTVSEFPLLVKFLDARQNLSIQVHPNDAYARLHEGQPFGKSEMWYVVAADPGAVIYQGLSHSMTPTELRSALESGSIVDHLAKIEVKPGDVFVNAPGTIHALGAGIVIFELQQSSDLTYRLYDWDRPSAGARRPLHVDRAVDVADYLPLSIHQVRPIRIPGPGPDRVFLGASQYYAAELWSIDGTAKVPAHGDRFELITVLDGQARIRIARSSPATANLSSGDTALIPAGIDEFSIASIGAPVRVIRSYVPNLQPDLVDPLRASGASDYDIRQLGGDPRASALGARQSFAINLTTIEPGGKMVGDTDGRVTDVEQRD